MIPQRYRLTDGQTDVQLALVILRSLMLCAVNSWARTRGVQLSTGYTVNTYSKPPMDDASKCDNVTRRSYGHQ